MSCGGFPVGGKAARSREERREGQLLCTYVCTCYVWSARLISVARDGESTAWSRWEEGLDA